MSAKQGVRSAALIVISLCSPLVGVAYRSVQVPAPPLLVCNWG